PWDDVLDLGEVHGYRNAQATVLAPTGTISFMMDCDTTGVEPDFSLVKSKKLVGGGEITIVNKTVPMALDKLGYAPDEVKEIEAFIDERNTIVGAPGDIFVDIAKEGTALAGLMNCFMIAVSIGLQYGVPLEVWVSKFAHMRFEPSGMTNDADIRIAKSIPDYVFRWMGKKFLDVEQQEEVGILSPEVRARLAASYAAGEEKPASDAGAAEAAPPGQTALFNNWEDAVECAKCGGRMV